MASIDLGRYEDEDEFGSEDEEEEAAGYRAQQQQGESRTSAAGANSRDYGSDEDDDGMASMPSELKGLRACMVCSLIKTHTQFLDEGCDNCESFLSLAERQDRVTELTSHTFEGMAAVHRPNESWVAKYQGIQMMKPGVYALEVRGVLNSEVEEFLKSKGIPYRAKAPGAV